MPEFAQGLFHVAFRVPTLRDLARAEARLAASGRRHSAQDHLFSQSLYIADPDGNKIEITHLTPCRGTARVEDGRLIGFTNDGAPHSILEPLDVADLRASLPEGETPGGLLPEGTMNDHIHFRRRDLARGFDFYTRLVGLSPSFFAPVTGFSDAGSPDHPHLVALNTWASDRLVAAPDGAAGMIVFTLILPEPDAAAARLRAEGIPVGAVGAGFACTDPDGNRLILAGA
jgi:catechol 2,3-dioxygenase